MPKGLKMDLAKFFDAVRSSLFGGSLSQSQVHGMDTLLDAAEAAGMTDPNQLGYVFGGVYHETGKKMIPVREGFASTDAGARAAVANLFRKKRISRDYAAPVNGVSYYGRGRIQNTHLANYQKLERRFGKPFVKNPDLLLDDAIDAQVTIVGHMEGIWTGKKLSDYIRPGSVDFRNARRVINGTDKADLIAGYARKFAAALKAAEHDVPVALVAMPDPAKAVVDLEKPAVKQKSVWAHIGQIGGGLSVITAAVGGLDWKVVAVLAGAVVVLAIVGLALQARIIAAVRSLVREADA